MNNDIRPERLQRRSNLTFVDQVHRDIFVTAICENLQRSRQWSGDRPRCPAHPMCERMVLAGRTSHPENAGLPGGRENVSDEVSADEALSAGNEIPHHIERSSPAFRASVGCQPRIWLARDGSPTSL